MITVNGVKPLKIVKHYSVTYKRLYINYTEIFKKKDLPLNNLFKVVGTLTFPRFALVPLFLWKTAICSDFCTMVN